MKPVIVLYGKESDRIAFVNSSKKVGDWIVNYKASFDNEESLRLADMSIPELFGYFAGMVNVFQQKKGDVLLLHDCNLVVAKQLMDVFCFPIHTIYVGKTNKDAEYDKIVSLEDLDEEVKTIFNIIK